MTSHFDGFSVCLNCLQSLENMAWNFDSSAFITYLKSLFASPPKTLVNRGHINDRYYPSNLQRMLQRMKQSSFFTDVRQTMNETLSTTNSEIFPSLS